MPSGHSTALLQLQETTESRSHRQYQTDCCYKTDLDAIVLSLINGR